MGGILETITGSLSAAAVTTAQAFAPNNPNTFTIRNATGQRDAALLSAWANVTVAGQVRIRSPRLHDANQALNMRALALNSQPLLSDGTKQGLYSQDLLIVDYTADVAPGAASAQGVALQVYYPDLVGGSQSSLRSWAEVEPFINNVLGQEMTPVSSATVGAWGPGQVLNANYDTFKAGKNYALLGYTCTDVGVAFGISGADTGNYIVGGPLTTDTQNTKNYFVELSNNNGLPLIPVISANNKLSTLVQVATLLASTVSHVGLILAELSN